MVNRTIDSNDLIQLYNSGDSVKVLSEKFNCARSVIVRILNENGIIQRGKSEAMFLRMSQTTPEERARLTASANATVRGVPQPIDRTCKSAITREKTLSGSTSFEIEICNMLINRGFNCIPQKAIGPYNIDIAIIEPPIAIEIFGGGWHNSGTHAARYRKRIEYILDSGFTPVIIWTVGNFINSGAIDYIITLSEKLSCSPPIRSEEHVIRGDGYLCSVGNRKFNCFPGKHLTYYRDVTTGRFTGASWEQTPGM